MSEISRTSIRFFLRGAVFTTFCHQKVVPKVSAGHLRRDRTAVLTERAQKTALFCTPAPGARTAVRSDSSSGAMRKCCALRATMILISFYAVLAGLRPARMHRENSGRSGGIGASARSDRAKSGVFRDRSASTGVVTRYFSLCLIFWCFWIKPKAQKKKCTTEEIDSYFGKYPAPPIGRFLRGADLPPFVTKRWRQKCPQGEKVGERPTACA